MMVWVGYRCSEICGVRVRCARFPRDCGWVSVTSGVSEPAHGRPTAPVPRCVGAWAVTASVWTPGPHFPMRCLLRVSVQTVAERYAQKHHFVPKHLESIGPGKVCVCVWAAACKGEVCR